MSVVATKVYKDKIDISADSILVRGWSTMPTNKNFSKLKEINEMIIGGVGYAEESSLIFVFAETHKPSAPTEQALLNFIIEFAEYKNKITGNYKIDNEFIILYGGKAFRIENMFVNEIKDYYAIGAGMDFANCALYLNQTTEEAVKTACHLCCMVSEPVITLTMKKKEEK